jgi:hypothetical protein
MIRVASRGDNKSQAMHSVSASRGYLEICEFPAQRHSPLARSGILARAVCAIAATLLHVALISTAVWAGTRDRIPNHQLKRVAASYGQVADAIALQWVTIDEIAAPDSSHPAAILALSPPRLTPIELTAALPEFVAVFPEETPDPASGSVASDDNTIARLRGQYLGQINARIDRAWLRPRAPIGEERFVCQVRIEQDRAGNVTEVALERCNGSPRWQVSLVHAIESASPLPAPSDPSVFARAIHMSFEAVPVELAVSREQYEPGS